jgi:recombination protein RecA
LPVIWATESPAGFRSGVSAPAGTPRRTTQVASTGLAAAAACRAAERLLRSGAFGLIVIDLARDLDIAPPSQGRLLRLAETHNAQVLILRRKREDGRYQGSLVAVRAESSSEQSAPGRFRVTVTSTKDKREGPGWTRASEFRGPPGLY